MAQTVQKNIRFTFEEWKRVEKEAAKRDKSPNRLVVELTMEGLGAQGMAAHRSGNPFACAPPCSPRRPSFATWRRTGREEEIEEISESISQVAPELPDRSAKKPRDRADLGSGN